MCDTSPQSESRDSESLTRGRLVAMSEDKSKSDVAKAREEEVATETAVKKQKTEDADARGDEEAEREEADEEVVDDVESVGSQSS